MKRLKIVPKHRAMALLQRILDRNRYCSTELRNKTTNKIIYPAYANSYTFELRLAWPKVIGISVESTLR